MCFPHRYQLKRNYCGPASLQIVAAYHGKETQQDFLAERCNVSKRGCTIQDLCDGAESIGLKAGAHESGLNKLSKDVKLPVIIHVSVSHYVVLYKIKEQEYYISDPKKGEYILDKEGFEDFWLKDKGTGYLILIEPAKAFRASTHDGVKS